MNLLRSFLIVAVLSAGLFPSAEAAPLSAPMKRILQERLVGKYDVRLDGLKQLNWSQARFAHEQKAASFEAYRVPYPRGAADYFSYAIYRYRPTKKFLVVRTGGFAGVFEVYLGSSK